jgi:putative sigma-54 modulation protein
MEIVVRGKNVDVPSGLRDTTETKLTKLARFAQDIGRVEVDFSEMRNRRGPLDQVCEVTLHLKRHVVKAHAAAAEQLDALDRTIDKLEHQVSRLKDKRISRSHPRRRRLDQHAAPPIDLGTDDGGPGDGGPDDRAPDDRAPDDEDGAALIVKTKQFETKPMRTDEAALQMDLLGHTFYLFTNAESGRAAVLYRRRDGHLGLIESSG